MVDNNFDLIAANDNSNGAISQTEGRPYRPSNTSKKRATSVTYTFHALTDVHLIDKSPVICPVSEKKTDCHKEDYLINCRTLTAMELRHRYPAEATAHKNMKNRCKTKSAVIDPCFEKFSQFLFHVGPMPAKGATLDRIDNNDREYAPGKVRWADKRTQNNNKSDTIIIQNSATGEAIPASRVARMQGITASAVRKRRDRGWSDEQIFAGKKNDAKPILKGKPTATTGVDMTLMKNIAFQRMADMFAYERKVHGEEALPASLDVLKDAGLQIDEAAYDAKFKREWPQYRPHLNFDKAEPFHQKLIAKLDPDYVKQWQEKKAVQAHLASHL